MSSQEFDQLGDLVIGYVQQMMKKRFGMIETWIGDARKKNGPKCNVFVSKDFYTNTGRCLVLI